MKRIFKKTLLGFLTVGLLGLNHAEAYPNTPETDFVQPNGPVHALAAQGQILYVGGEFTLMGNQSRQNFAAVNAETGEVLSLDRGTNGTVTELEVVNDILFVAGEFTTIGGQSHNRLAALDRNTGQVKTWNLDADGSVEDVFYNGSRLFIAGDFSTIGGQSISRLAELDLATGLIKSDFSFNPNGVVKAAVGNSDYLYIGGDFTKIGTRDRARIAAINLADNSLNFEFRPSVNGLVNNLYLENDDFLFLGGKFSAVKGEPRDRIAAIFVEGNDLATFSFRIEGPNGTDCPTCPQKDLSEVYNLVVHGSAVYITGYFNNFDRENRRNLVEVASFIEPSDWIPNPNGAVRSIVFIGDKMIVGGDFTGFNATGEFLSSPYLALFQTREEIKPTVSLTAPANGVYLKETISLAANAADNVGVTKVEFYDGDTKIGEDSTAPYALEWDTVTSNVSDGPHTIKAKAYDSAGNVSDPSDVTITVDNRRPFDPAITAPEGGIVAWGNVEILVNATDNIGIAKVEFWVDGEKIGEDVTPPGEDNTGRYRLIWDVFEFDRPDGDYEITVISYDHAGNSNPSNSGVTVKLNSDIPEVTIALVDSKYYFNGPVQFTATAFDGNGISKVEFSARNLEGEEIVIGEDVAAPYSFLWDGSGFEDGRYYMKAIAYDSLDYIAQSDDDLDVVLDRVNPVVEIQSPLDGEIVEGLVEINSLVSDLNGIFQVELYIDQTKVETVKFETATDASFTWDTSGVPVGMHMLRVEVLDVAGNRGVSNEIQVQITQETVDREKPRVDIVSPFNNATIQNPVTIQVEAGDNVGVTKVEFLINGSKVGEDTSSPYMYSADVSAGSYDLQARAYDAEGNEGLSETVSVTVEGASENEPPMVTLTSPSAGAYSGDITITVQASDDQGISRIEYLSDGFLIGSFDSPVFTFIWETGIADNGSHAITVRVTDTDGVSRESNPVNIVVQNVAAQDPNLNDPLSGGVHVSRNPYHPGQDGPLGFQNVPESGSVRIYTIRGSLVREITTDSSGAGQWDGRDGNGEIVSSGSYIVHAKGNGSAKTFQFVVIK